MYTLSTDVINIAIFRKSFAMLSLNVTGTISIETKEKQLAIQAQALILNRIEVKNIFNQF